MFWPPGEPNGVPHPGDGALSTITLERAELAAPRGLEKVLVADPDEDRAGQRSRDVIGARLWDEAWGTDVDLFRAHPDANALALSPSRLDRNADGIAPGERHQAPPILRAAVGSLEQIGRAQELGHERRGRALVDGFGWAELFDPALVHDRDPVGNGHRLFLIVGHEDEGDANLLLDAFQLKLHLLSELEIESAKRLVEEQDLGVIDKRPSQRHPLLLAAGELRGAPLAVPAEIDQLERFQHPSIDVLTGDLATAQSEGHVVEDVEGGEEPVRLEHRIDIPPVGREIRNVAPVQRDRPLGRRLEASDHAERRRFAAA